MKPNLAEDVIPVSKFKKDTATFLKEIRSKERTVVLTQNGHSAAVVLSPEAFERLQYERDLFSSIAKGEAEIEAGQGISHEKVFQQLEHYLLK